MTLEGLGEMFRGYFAETCAGKIPLVPMGSERRVPRARTRGARPPSALAELFKFSRHEISILIGRFTADSISCSSGGKFKFYL